MAYVLKTSQLTLCLILSFLFGNGLVQYISKLVRQEVPGVFTSCTFVCGQRIVVTSFLAKIFCCQANSFKIKNG